MQRDPRLQGLSSEHHANLVLARSLTRAAESGDSAALTAAAALLLGHFEREIERHLQAEESTLFPALRALPQTAALCQLAEQDHAALRNYAQRVAAGEHSAIALFAQCLQTHTRLEEREIFPLAQELLDDETLNAVLQAAPKASRSASNSALA